jgi:sulfonate transport system substrate-binding protein
MEMIDLKVKSLKLVSWFASIILGLSLTACGASVNGNIAATEDNAAVLNTEASSEETNTEETGAEETDAAIDTDVTNTEPSSNLEEVRIGFPTSGGDFPGGVYGVALNNGYLEEYLNPLGYTASPQGFVGAAPAIHEALVAEELDFVIYAGMASDLSRANGIEHTLLSVTGWGGYWKLIARTGAGIESIADLKGKKIAYTRGASPHMYLIRVLTEADIAWEEIDSLNMTLPEGIAGVVSGSIDATVVSAGYEAELVANGSATVIHNQFTADKDVYYEPSVYIGRTAYYNEHKDVAVAIQKALLKAKDWVKEDPDAYFKLSADKSGNPLEIILETANYNIDESLPLDLNEKYIDSLKSILTFLQDNELTVGDIDFDAWIDDTVVVRALEEYTSEKP